MASGSKVQQTARAGEHYVAAELNRRGAYAVTFAGNMPGIDILASNENQSRTVMVQVKTRRAGNWHCSIDHGKKCQRKQNETVFWIFVDISMDDESPVYFIVPDWWISNDIYEAHHAYLDKHGGKRKTGSDSKHHSITTNRIEKWKDRWDVLKLF